MNGRRLPSAGFSITVRVSVPADASMIGRLTTELNIERPDQGGGTRLRMCFANG